MWNAGRIAVMAISMLVATVWAQDVDSLIQQEIESYITGLQSSNLSQVASTAEKVSGSGINDDRLYKVVAEQLDKYHQQQLTNPKNESLVPVMKGLIRALASSGKYEYRFTLDRILSESKSRVSRRLAKHVGPKMLWYKQRNEIMGDMAGHVEGQSLFVTRFLNLLTHQDQTFNRYGYEELYRQGEADKVLTDYMMDKLEADSRSASGGVQIDILAWYCRTVIKLDKPGYSLRVQALVDDKSVHKKLRKHCDKEMDRN